MIEFYGDISNDCKRYIIKTGQRITFTVCLIIALIISIPVIILSINKSLVYSIILLALLIYVSCSLSIPKGKNLGYVIPQRIIIGTEEIISEGKLFYRKKFLTSVKKVVDFGGWYHIYFKFPYMAVNFVCQKDLIVKGTIEEFEEMFSNKIIRKAV